MKFRASFPSVRNLLAGTALSGNDKPAPVAKTEDEDEDGGGNDVDPEALQAAIDKDAKALVAATNKRWSDVLASDEGKANPTMAHSLLSNTDMSAEAVIKTMKDGGVKASTAAPDKPDNGDKPDEQEQRQSRARGRDRLRADRNLDKPTGGAGNREDDRGATSFSEKRREMQDKKNDRRMSFATRGQNRERGRQRAGGRDQ